MDFFSQHRYKAVAQRGFLTGLPDGEEGQWRIDMPKIKKLSDMRILRQALKRDGRKVVLTNGCFDILHSGHVYLFEQAKTQGDVLVVAVNDDASVRRLKGRSRPIFPLEERLEVLSALSAVDYLVSFSEDTPLGLVEILLPDVLVKGGDWKPEDVVGKSEVETVGGRVVIIPYVSGRSTSEMIRRIRGAAGSE